MRSNVMGHANGTEGAENFVDQLRPGIGGYPVFIQRGLGYDEAVIIDQNAGREDRPPRPAVLVNGPNAMCLAHPGLDVWGGLNLWLADQIERAAEKAIARIDRSDYGRGWR